MHKMGAGKAVLMDEATTGTASMLMREHQDLRCAVSLKMVAYLGEHLAEMPWKETASEGTQVMKARNLTNPGNLY